MLDPAALKRASALLDQRVGLDALWVFGSEAAGTATSASDLDLAALFRRRPSPSECLALRAELASVVGRDVDLVDLERASPVLVMQVLRHGALVADRNPEHRLRFTATAPGRYEDLVLVRRTAERRLLERVRGGRP